MFTSNKQKNLDMKMLLMLVIFFNQDYFKIYQLGRNAFKHVSALLCKLNVLAIEQLLPYLE